MTVISGERRIPAVTANIGPRGAFVLTALELGAPVTVEIPSDRAGAQVLEARVVRVVRRATEGRGLPGTALRWVSTPDSPATPGASAATP